MVQPSMSCSSLSPVAERNWPLWQVVAFLGHLVGGLCEAGGKLALQHLYLGVDALACATDDEVASGVEVLQKLAKALERTEERMCDTLKIAQSPLEGVVGVGLETVENIHIRRIRAYGHHLYDALAVGVCEIVYTHEGVSLGDKLIGRCTLHRRGEVLELNPCQHLFSRALAACLGHDEFVLLGYGVVVARLRDTAILLHHDAVVLAEGVVHPALVGVEIHLARCSIVVVYL